ncbi:MAG: hypothetical protein AAGD35_05195 [Actinomycetota bacterium]
MIHRNPLHPRLTDLRPWQHTAAAAAAVAVLLVVNAVLEALYARSMFPVPFAEGQTTFDGQRLKRYYAVMLDAGTLDVYWFTQLFDVVFMAAVAVAAFAIGSRLLRANADHPRTQTVISVATTAVVGSAAFDAVENLLSFTMLVQPRSFPEWLALPYSTAAVAKFALAGIGWTTMAAALALTVVRWALGHRR